MKGTIPLLKVVIACATLIALYDRVDAITDPNLNSLVPIRIPPHYLLPGEVTGRIDIEPSYLTLDQPGSCSDISVSAFTEIDNPGSILASYKTLSTTVATGQFSLGYCEYTLYVPPKTDFGLQGGYSGPVPIPGGNQEVTVEGSQSLFQVGSLQSLGINLSLDDYEPPK